MRRLGSLLPRGYLKALVQANFLTRLLFGRELRRLWGKGVRQGTRLPVPNLLHASVTPKLHVMYSKVTLLHYNLPRF